MFGSFNVGLDIFRDHYKFCKRLQVPSNHFAGLLLFSDIESDPKE